MGAVALVVAGGTEVFALDDVAAARLADLGVTRVSILRDPTAVAIVLEGWAFDPERSGADAERALLGRAGEARVFRDLAQVSLSQTSRL